MTCTGSPQVRGSTYLGLIQCFLLSLDHGIHPIGKIAFKAPRNLVWKVLPWGIALKHPISSQNTHFAFYFAFQKPNMRKQFERWTDSPIIATYFHNSRECNRGTWCVIIILRLFLESVLGSTGMGLFVVLDRFCILIVGAVTWTYPRDETTWNSSPAHVKTDPVCLRAVA